MHSLSDAFPLPIKEEGKGISPGVSIKLKLLQKKFLVRRIFFFNAFPNEKCHVRFGSEADSSRFFIEDFDNSFQELLSAKTFPMKDVD